MISSITALLMFNHLKVVSNALVLNYDFKYSIEKTNS